MMGATLRDGLLLKRRGYAWLRRRASLRTFVGSHSRNVVLFEGTFTKFQSRLKESDDCRQSADICSTNRTWWIDIDKGTVENLCVCRGPYWYVHFP